MLVAILLVALGTILAADIAYRNAMSARRATATLSFDEALLVAQGAEALSAYGLRAVLSNGRAGSTGSVDVTAQQPWAEPVGPIEVVPGVTLEAQLEDMQGRFNLNWLVTPASGMGGLPPSAQGANPGATGTGPGQPDPTAVDAFRKLLELSQIDPKWVDMVVDWIDRDNQPQTQGAEDSAYMGQNPAYLAANQYITSTTELLALPGFGRENYAKLAPFIAALPPSSKLNVCTAKGHVLDAFNKNQNEWQDEAALQKQRAAAPGCFPDLATINSNLGSKAVGAQTSRFVQTSSYFRLSSLITIGSDEYNQYSLLY